MARGEIQLVVQDATGTASHAPVTISIRGGANTTIYADEFGAGTLSNPQIPGDDGRILGWLDEGSYTVAIGAPLNYTRQIEVVSGRGVSRLADNAVTTAKLQDDAVTSDKLATNAVTSAKLAANAVTESKLADAAASTRTQADASVTPTEIADAAVSTRALGIDAVTQAQLANDAVDTAQLVDSTIPLSSIANAAVTNAKLLDSVLTDAHLGTDAVTAVKVGAAQITTKKLAADVIPVGTIIPFAGIRSPNSAIWKFCDGTAIAPGVDLSAAWGGVARYGTSGANWLLPDLRGRLLFMANPSGPEATSVGASDGVTNLAVRSPFHGHTPGTISTTGGTHGHFYAAGSDCGKGSYAYVGWAGYGDHNFGGLSIIASGASTHGHSLVNSTGSLAAPDGTNAAAFVSINFLIKVARE